MGLVNMLDSTSLELDDRIDPMEYRRAQVAMEHEGTWRGMFLCSAGIIEAVKDPA